jgi:UDP-N-acetylmuramoyl-L-alanyl-D-glutamate--2,6-diaminopimelate ligase
LPAALRIFLETKGEILSLQASTGGPRGSQDALSSSAEARNSFRVACVTGTNGKTTTTSLIEAIVAAAGEPTARVTTLGAWVRGAQVERESTPEAFLATIRKAFAARVTTLALETTSQSLAGGFASSFPPDVAVFTNLSRDHLDYHKTPEHYLASKAQLFMNLRPGGTAILNAADPSSALLDEVTPAGLTRLAYAARPVDPDCTSLPLALAASRVEVTRRGTRVLLAPSPLADQLGGTLTLRLVGHVHAENALAAALAGHALGCPPAAIQRGLEAFAGVPGRFQVIHTEPTVVVDYAHTPDALERTLDVARTLAEPDQGKVLCVFGCGGDRDPGKRGEMGHVAATRADVVIVTTDNPRREDPEAIADAIVAGMEGRFGELHRIWDRAGAIRRAIGSAGPRDIVVIAGKGHEKTQIFRDRVVSFDDVEVARSALRAVSGVRGRKRRP